MTDTRVGFIGAGQMAEALARGFVNKGVIKAENICCTDPMPERKEVFRGLKATAFESNADVRTLLVYFLNYSSHMRSPGGPLHARLTPV